MEKKKLIAYINAENELADSILRKAENYERVGADEIFIYNYSLNEGEREEFLLLMRQIAQTIDLPLIIGFNVKRLEDAKKALYTGASRLVIPYRRLKDFAAIKEITDRFGKDKLLLEVDASEENNDQAFYGDAFVNQCMESGVAGILVKHLDINALTTASIAAAKLPVYVRDSLTRNDIESLMSLENVAGVATNYYADKDMMKIKLMLKEAGILVNVLESAIDFASLKKNEAGLVPVIIQDYRTQQVLQLAYMNEESFEATLRTGHMTYYSRSRNELWEKGLTSGHFQYVKELTTDCDKDTILAKVKQIGGACHTGAYSCFFNKMLESTQEDLNPLKVFNEVYDVILDRKKNPKEGSYTNYLFDKGIDKILKKCGEEATEIVIAAKNPEKEEIKYEVADFLYHLMVLMVECNVDWNDIVRELAHRR